MMAGVLLRLMQRCSKRLEHSVRGLCESSSLVVQATSEIPLTTGRSRLVILGTGWAAARLLRDIKPSLYDLVVVSPRNHMVFTPLLASTTVGTLEFRSVALPIRDIQPALQRPQNAFHVANAVKINHSSQVVECLSPDNTPFAVAYDALAIATGAAGSTFGIPGVHEHAHFLRNVTDASRIRTRLIDLLASAGTPGRSSERRSHLLHFVIVGGGPTGVEFAGEICDFIDRDIRRLYPERARYVRVTMVEGREILGSFDVSLREYAAQRLTRMGVRLYKGVVARVEEDRLVLKDGTVMPFGLCVWSTGVGPTPFIESLPFAKTNVGRLAVNEHLQVMAEAGQDMTEPSDATSATIASHEEASGHPATHLTPCGTVFALGDCAANASQPLPALAQVAEQQGKHLAHMLNSLADRGDWSNEAIAAMPPFGYRSLGSMASLGQRSGVLQVGSQNPLARLTGISAWFAWRSAYLTRLGSVQKRLEVAFDWTLTLLFGRDTSRW